MNFADRVPPGLRVVFPEGEDARIQAAADIVAREVSCEPILLTTDRAPSDASIAHYVQARGGRVEAAQRRLRRPLFHGAAMVACGEADALIAGATSPTRRVIEALRICLEMAPGVRMPSSCFLMQAPEQPPLVFADCAVNVEPDAATLADIAIASAATASRLLGVTPRVAMLSFSTRGSASHGRVDKVREAVALARERAPELLIDGELQADAALDAVIAARKVGADSSVAGRANVLVFPDLDSGNIAYKLVQLIGRASAIGPLLQGFSAPVADLSRGADVEEIVQTTLATLAGARG